MSELSIENLNKISKLAMIKIYPEDQQRLQKELGAIISVIDQLKEVDTEGVEPMVSPIDLPLPMRDDIITDGGIADKILSNAPSAAADCFEVPKIVE